MKNRTFVVSMDITSLFTNIPHNEGIDTVWREYENFDKATHRFLHIICSRFHWHTGIDVQPATPCSFLVPPKIIYVSKRIELTFPSVSNKPPFISFYYIVPCNQQGSQIRICNKSFGDCIGTILENKGEINDQSNDASVLHVL